MTFKRFFGFGILLWVLLSVLKAVFLNVLSLDGVAMQIIFSFLLMVIAMACVRRLGVINYLEAMLVAALWTIGALVGDFVVTEFILGRQIFQSWVFWVGYVLIALAIFFFHKKRHVQIRRELAAHHAHHGHGGEHAAHHKSHGDHHQQPHGHAEPGKHH